MERLLRVGGVAAGSLLISLVDATPGLAAFPVSVNVVGVSWIVETIENSGNDIQNLGTTAVSPWWGDDTLANQFAVAAFNAGGGTVQGNGPNVRGPFFAVESTTSPPGFGFVTYRTDGSLDSGTVNGNQSRVFATATRVNTSSVPGPLPILGATAAFGISRRLRRRISLSTHHDPSA